MHAGGVLDLVQHGNGKRIARSCSSVLSRSRLISVLLVLLVCSCANPAIQKPRVPQEDEELMVKMKAHLESVGSKLALKNALAAIKPEEIPTSLVERLEAQHVLLCPASAVMGEADATLVSLSTSPSMLFNKIVDTAEPRLSAADMSEKLVSAMIVSTASCLITVGQLPCGVWPTIRRVTPLAFRRRISGSGASSGMPCPSRWRHMTTECL